MHSHHIKKLIISGNSISDKITLDRLCEMLWRNNNLEHFELDECQIGETGGVCIGEALIKGSKLKYLSLKSNEISDEGVSRLANGLEINKTLTDLYLGKN